MKRFRDGKRELDQPATNAVIKELEGFTPFRYARAVWGAASWRGPTACLCVSVCVCLCVCLCVCVCVCM